VQDKRAGRNPGARLHSADIRQEETNRRMKIALEKEMETLLIRL